jgi:hypothetical protein
MLYEEGREKKAEKGDVVNRKREKKRAFYCESESSIM